MIQLVTSFYLDKSPLRQGELLFCLEQNLKAGFDYVFIYVDTANELDYLSTYLNELSKITEISEYRIVVGHEDIRTTYNQYFERTLKNSITVLCNSDIFFSPLSVKLVRSYYEDGQNKDVALCLTRWDYNINQQHELFDRPDSQDTWVVFGLIKGKTSIEFGLGRAGCDNRIAHELEQMGYIIKNPSKTIQTVHVHSSNVRNYLHEGKPKEIIPPPYKLISPEY